MYQFPIGVMLESFRMDTPTALKKAAAMGAKGIQMYATKPGRTPKDMTPEKQREMLQMMEDNGLVFSAICGDLGKGFWRPEYNREVIDESKRIMELAKKLGTDIVTTHIGVVPADTNHPRFKIMQEACGELAEFADNMGSHFAIETGPETSAVLKVFLDSLHSTGVAVNLDPANLVMSTGDDPVQAVHNLKDYIVHTHAKDGNRLMEVDPEIIYGVLEVPLPDGEIEEEVPLGTGSVPFDGYLKALEEVGYRGFLTIEREVGEEPEKDIKLAVDFLQEKIKTL